MIVTIEKAHGGWIVRRGNLTPLLINDDDDTENRKLLMVEKDLEDWTIQLTLMPIETPKVA